jgi:hypothetical protein
MKLAIQTLREYPGMTIFRNHVLYFLFVGLCVIGDLQEDLKTYYPSVHLNDSPRLVLSQWNDICEDIAYKECEAVKKTKTGVVVLDSTLLLHIHCEGSGGNFEPAHLEYCWKIVEFYRISEKNSECIPCCNINTSLWKKGTGIVMIMSYSFVHSLF